MGQQKVSDHRLVAHFRICLILFVFLSLPFAILACKKETPPPSSAPTVPSSPRGSATPAPTPAASQPAEKESPPQAPTYTYDPKGRADPFVPLISAQVRIEAKKGLKGLTVSELKLAGIVWDRTEYVALVEGPDRLGYILKVNDVIGSSARVARISPSSVIFEVKEKPYLPDSSLREVELKLKKEE